MIADVLVYTLFEQDELTDRDAALEHHLAAAATAALQPWFEALPAGCFRWEDAGLLGRNATGGQPPATAAAARQCAATFMRAANQAAAADRARRGIDRLHDPDPFPIESLQPGEIRRVRSSETGLGDHWLTTWTVSLPAARMQRGVSPVFGATVEVRVGAAGRVVAVVSRARPWKTAISRPALPYAAQDPHDVAHSDAGDGNEPTLVYFCDNPSERQRFLAPCWLIVPDDEDDHHARRFWPASDHTVLPEIVVQIENGTGVVSAQVLGAGQRTTAVEHGDQWQLRWAVADLREFIAGERAASEGSSAALAGPGIHQVGLEVEHVATGAVRSTHAQIAIAVPDPGEPSAAPLREV